jgi:hypothetical protein
MATPISFQNHMVFLLAFGDAVYRPYNTERDRWNKVANNFSAKQITTTCKALANVSNDAEFEVLQSLCRNIAGLEFKRRKTGSIDIYPRISWEQSWSELSFYLQLNGEIPACEDGNARLSVMKYRKRSWKYAVWQNLERIIHINDLVIGNPTYYNQTLTKIETAMNALYESLNLPENIDAP